MAPPRPHAAAPLVRSDLPLPLVRRGKVREMYDAGRDRLLMVASDRVSAFDVVMAEPIPRKGEVLTMLTAWWLARLEKGAGAGDGAWAGEEGSAGREAVGVRRAASSSALRPVRHHLLAADPDEIAAAVPALEGHRAHWARRSLLVRRTEPLPVECVVRGYLSGSAWREYRDRGTLAGEPLPEGLRESERLPEPLFSPATKAETGHDENIPFSGVEERVGGELAGRLRERSLGIYAFASDEAARRGIILADTKFEFGLDSSGELRLIDEVLTPDSSRYWPVEGYRVGATPPSLDKQPVRDFLDGLGTWDKQPPPPPLPPEVVQASTARYLEIFRRLAGVELDEFSPPPLRPEGDDRGHQ